MTTPKSFTYKEAQSDNGYQNTPTGNLDINRLVNNKAFWIRPGPPYLTKQKKLVLADWTARNWSESKIKEVRAALHDLIAAGFSLYLWQDGEVKALTLDEIACLDNQELRKKITLVQPSFIAEVAAQQQQLTDKILVLDDYWVDQLVNKNKTDTRHLATSDVLGLNESERQRLLTVMDNASPKLHHIIHDEFSETANRVASELERDFSAVISPQYEKMKLLIGELEDWVATGVIEGLHLDLNQLSKLKQLDIVYSGSFDFHKRERISGPLLQKILEATHELESLSLTGGMIIDLFLDQRLDKLKRIVLHRVDFSCSSFNNLLRQCPRLKKLSFDNASFKGDLNTITVYESIEELALTDTTIFDASLLKKLLFAFPNVKTLNLEESRLTDLENIDNLKLAPLDKIEILNLSKANIHPAVLEKLLAAMPNLKELNLSECNLKKPINIKEGSLNKLEVVNLDYSDITASNIETIVKSAPNIKKLYASKTVSANCISSIPTTSTELEVLEISWTKISLDELQKILTELPNLNSLCIDGCENLSGDNKLILEKLQSLEKLDVGESTLSSDNLQIILNHASKLKILDLTGRQDLKLSLQKGSLSSMEKLELSGASLCESELQTCLSAMPNLISLNLSSFNLRNTHVGPYRDIELEPLNALQTLDLRNSKNSSDVLKALLKAAPNLIDLKLARCVDLPNDLDLRPNSLLLLKTINLSNSSISLASLSALLAAAPNLISLDLSGCEHIDHKFDLRPDSLLLLKTINLSNSSISSASLSALLDAAPNLISLNLHGCEHIGHNFDLKPNSLLLLKTIDLFGSSISSASLSTLLAAATNINELDLSNCEHVEAVGDIMPNSLQYLEKLILSRSNINHASLTTLIAAAPNIRQLDLTACEKIGDLPDLKPNSLMQLGVLTFGKSIGSTATGLNKLLAAAPNLEELDLTNCKNIDAILDLKPDSLPHLKKLKLCSSVITSASLQKLLVAAPNLRKLNLGGCENIVDRIDINNKRLEYLEELSLPRKAPKSVIESLLSLFPNVKTLDFGDFETVKGPLKIKANSLSGIKKLSFRHTKIDSECLVSILAAVNKLQELDISHCKNLNGALEIKATSLNHLKNLRVDGSHLTAKSLKALLVAAPTINELFVEDCINVDNTFKLDPDSLSSLEYIWIRGNDVIFAALIAAAPNLKYINGQVVTEEMKTSFLEKRKKAIAKQQHIKRPGDQVLPLPLIDQAHDSKRFKDYKPTDPKEPFKFSGINNRINQGMIIDKLCQYLTLTNKNTFSIPKIKNGLCQAMSEHFIQKGTAWPAIIESFRTWQGTSTSLTDQLRRDFDDLYDNYVSPCYITCKKTNRQYLGDNLASYLHSLSAKSSCILTNPWHAIALRKENDNQWTVYDPNFINGAKTVNANDLIPLIHTAIGSIVSVDSKTLEIKPKIDNPDAFIEHGGLLAFHRFDNGQELLEQIPANHKFSKEALEGITIRNLDAIPAWVEGISSENTVKLTLDLLRQFIAINPQDYKDKLKRSISELNGFRKQDCKTNLINFLTAEDRQAFGDDLINLFNDAKLQALDSVKIPSEENQQKSISNQTNKPTKKQPNPSEKRVQAVKSTNKELYERYLNSLSSDSQSATSLTFCQESTQQDGAKTRLIQLASTQDVVGMRWLLQNYCNKVKRPMVYINSADDLTCSASYIKRDENNIGTLKKGPGGPLHDFLTSKEGAEAPVIIVNYDNFSDDELVRLNTLLDKDRFADNTHVNESAIVIGLINKNKPDCYQGSDFYSRFEKIDDSPLSSQELSAKIPEFNVSQAPENEALKPSHTKQGIINLYHASDWKERLVGRWVLKNDRLQFEEGSLVKALRENATTITIQNGLWDQPNFQRFWQETCSQGFIENSNPRVNIPPSFQLIQQEGYAWDRLATSMQVKTGVSPNALTLNPSRLGYFFSNYRCDNKTATLNTIDGFIDAAFKAGEKTLDVNLSRQLGEDEWAMLLEACENKIKLIVHCAPGIDLPEKLRPTGWTVAQKTEPSNWKKQTTQIPATQVIRSSDIDTTVELLTKPKQTQWMVIDISECSPSDLLYRVNGKLDKQPEQPRFDFEQTDSALVSALKANKNIILKGQFSAELRDELEDYLGKRQRESNSMGKLVLVCDHETQFSSIPNQIHQVTVAEKRECLVNGGVGLSDQMLEGEALSILKARHANLGTDPWLGMYRLPIRLHMQTEFDPATAKNLSEKFDEKRLLAVNEVLAQSPFVFLTGLTGVGKTGFIDYTLGPKVKDLYRGESEIKQWAENSIQDTKILFIDEANLSAQEWSQFEGLYHKPPGILINDRYYPLDEHHKVVFAGNPCSYGDRKLASLFRRHGNSVVFEPLPAASLYHLILEPVFETKPPTISDFSSQDIVKISQQLLEVYGYLCDCSDKEVLISPRELQMMALLVKSHGKKANENIEAITKQVIWDLAKHLVPKDKQEDFNKRFKPISSTSPAPLKTLEKVKNFVITPSRNHIYQQIKDVLQLRQDRKRGVNDVQKYGGLGGIVIEGEPGEGKSDLVHSTLAAQGFEKHEMLQLDKQYEPGNYYYHIPASMSCADKEAWLLKAFDEGAVVVIDEINSSPMMERFLNDLLMGKRPPPKNAAAKGKQAVDDRPKNPGFMVIGTQNPMTMGGRQATSSALKRRLINVDLPNYPPEELQAILAARIKSAVGENERLAQTEANAMIEAFQTVASIARKNNKSPINTFRNLIRLGDCFVEGKIKTTHQTDLVQHLLEQEKEQEQTEPQFNDNDVEQLIKDIKLDELIEQLDNKVKRWEKGGFDKAIAAAKEIARALENTKTLFRKDKNKTEFIKNCQTALGSIDSRTDLGKHRGILKNIAANFMASLLTLGLVNLVRYAQKKSVFFTTKTDTINKVEKFQKTIGQLGKSGR